MLNRIAVDECNNKRNINKPCLSSKITGSRNKSSFLSSSLITLPQQTVNIDNNDAILVSTIYTNHLVSRISPTTTKNLSRTAPRHTKRSNFINYNQIATTVVGNFATTYKHLGCQQVDSTLTTNSNLTQQQLVNSRTNNKTNTSNNCFNVKGSPKQQQQKPARKMVNPIYCLTALLLTLCTLLSTHTQVVLADLTLISALRKLNITPEILPSVSSDVGTIRVDLMGNQVKPGDPIPAKNFHKLDMTKITYDVNSWDARYTLLLLDLDKKPGLNGTHNIYNQFTSLNIPGNAIPAGQALVAFEPPTVPCHPSTKHRILMLAYHQEQSIDIPDVIYIAASSGQSHKRENFKLDEFTNRHRLELMAANVFLAIGDASGVCSGSSSTLHSLQNVWLSSPILIAMVISIVISAFTIPLNGRRHQQPLMMKILN